MQSDFFDGHIYHMVSFNNLESIFKRRAILSKERVLQEKLIPTSIANEDVQDKRDRIFVLDNTTNQYRSLHSYVPFYFTTFTPMLYKQKMRFPNYAQGSIVFFEVSRAILKESGVLFTDGNATNQQLSNGGERVGITPGTDLESCSRKYRPGGPYGTNLQTSKFYSDTACLEYLKWEIINDRWWYDDEEKKRIKHTEALVPELLPLAKIQGIAAMNLEMAQAINELIEDSGLDGRIPYAASKPHLYF